MKSLFIDRGITQNRAVVYSDGSILNMYIENIDDINITGNIYKGRIENIVPALNAAFVNIGHDKNAILHFEGNEEIHKFQRGQDLLVQVSREGIGEKGPRISRTISIPGKYIVLLPESNYIGISSKIEDSLFRRNLRNAIESEIEKGFGIIVRTEATETCVEEIINEYKLLVGCWKDILAGYSIIRAPQILYNTRDFYSYVIREYAKNDIDQIKVSREDDVELITQSLRKTKPQLEKRISFNKFDFSFVELIDKEIFSILEGRIPLPSGGYLVIDKTEAFTAIDVNSGSFTEKNNPRETILATNLEACREIANIIKLRNLSGIILVDFIDMDSDESRNNILDCMMNELKYDKSGCRVYGFTNLGIMEITRTKKGRSVSELIYDNIETRLFNPHYLLKIIENKCIKFHVQSNKSTFRVLLSPEIYTAVNNTLNMFIKEMKRIYKIDMLIEKSDFVDGYLIEKGNEDISMVKISTAGRTIKGNILSFSEDYNGIFKIEIKGV